MKNQKNNIAVNLQQLRNSSHMSQEEVAERIGVSRQAVAKWESGETLPDILNCEALAELFDVHLDDLVRYNSQAEGMPIGPKDKHIFGTVTINERGQIVLPKKARAALSFKPGDTLIVLGDTGSLMPGIALVGSETFMRMAGDTFKGILGGEGENI